MAGLDVRPRHAAPFVAAPRHGRHRAFTRADRILLGAMLGAVLMLAIFGIIQSGGWSA